MVRTHTANGARVGAGRRLIDLKAGNGRVAAHDRAGARATELAHRLQHSAGASTEHQYGVVVQGEIAEADGARGAQYDGAGVDISRALAAKGVRVEREHAGAFLGQGASARARQIERIGKGDVIAVGI